MANKKRTAFLLVLGLTAAGLAVPWNLVAANDLGHRCRFEGTWGQGTPFGSVSLENVVSLDNANNRVAITLHAVGWAQDFDIFPLATKHTDVVGEARRTGPREFQFTLTWFGTDDLNNIVYRAVAVGIKSFRPDCRRYDFDSTFEFFDADGVSVGCFPVAGGPFVRLDDMEMCE